MLVNLGMFRYMYMKLLEYDISTENVNVHLDRDNFYNYDHTNPVDQICIMMNDSGFFFFFVNNHSLKLSLLHSFFCGSWVYDCITATITRVTEFCIFFYKYF